MATSTATVQTFPTALPGRRYDHQFFMATTVAMIATIFVGFARSYYLAGVFHAPLPSTIIHIHGAVFTGWLLIFIAQTSLVSAGRIDIHRRLGMFAVGYTALMVVLGLMAATDSLVHNFGPVGRNNRAFYLVPVSEILAFATIMVFAFRYRKNPATHKRLIYVANVALALPAIARMPIPHVERNNPAASLVSNVFLLLLVTYDYWSTRKIYRSTIYASLFLIFIQQARAPLSQTSAWISFAGSVQQFFR